jgi:hypothetical protein
MTTLVSAPRILNRTFEWGRESATGS